MNQTKKILAYLGCIAFTILGIWLLTVEDPTTSYPLWTIIRFKGNRLITIQMKDPEKIITNESSWIKRKTMEYNMKTINALYSFPAYMMDGRADEALALCKQKLAKHN